MISLTSNWIFGLLHALGWILICGAIFLWLLYEDEEGRIHSKFQDWWIRLDDRRKASRSHMLPFIQEVAGSTRRWSDRLFGRRLFSLRFVFVSIYLSIASFFLLAAISLPLVPKRPASVSVQGALSLFIVVILFASVPALTDSKIVLGIWWLVNAIIVLKITDFLLFVSKVRSVGLAARGMGYTALFFGTSLFVDLLYITLARWILRWISKEDSAWGISLALCVNFLALGGSIIGPISLGLEVSKYAAMAGAMIVFSFVLNVIDVLASLAGFLVALTLLVHRFFWSVIQRPLYAIQRYRLLTRRKLLFWAGIVLALLPTHGSAAFLRSLLLRL